MGTMPTFKLAQHVQLSRELDACTSTKQALHIHEGSSCSFRLLKTGQERSVNDIQVCGW